MAGALKPPWITKSDFYRTPFNYCDRWCEKCNLTDICRVYKEVEKSRKKFIKQGKDPDSLECVFQTIKENLEKTAELLRKDAQKLGIDFAKVDIQPEPPEPEKYPLYKITRKYSFKLSDLLKNLRVIPFEADESLVSENAEIIAYYHHLIPAKVYRAILSREEEKNEEDFLRDSKTSAFIAVNSLLNISEALINLAEHYPLMVLRPKIVRLGKISLDLTRILRLEFDLDQSFKASS